MSCPMCTSWHMQSTHVPLGMSSCKAKSCPGPHITQTAAGSGSPVLDPGRISRKNSWWHNSNVINQEAEALGMSLLS